MAMVNILPRLDPLQNCAEIDLQEAFILGGYVQHMGGFLGSFGMTTQPRLERIGFTRNETCTWGMMWERMLYETGLKRHGSGVIGVVNIINNRNKCSRLESRHRVTRLLDTTCHRNIQNCALFMRIPLKAIDPFLPETKTSHQTVFP